LDEADPGYDTARTSFNALLDRRPSIIARAACVEDVVAAVAFAQEQGLAAAIRGGGHSVAGHSMCDGDMVVDLRLLRGRLGGGRAGAFLGAARGRRQLRNRHQV
jgi:FAD/FMN-containing dehydrogenase